MRPKPVRVWKLAQELGVDVEEILLTVWEYEEVDGRIRRIGDRRDLVPARIVPKVRSAISASQRPRPQNVPGDPEGSLRKPPSTTTSPTAPRESVAAPTFAAIGRRKKLRLLSESEVLAIHDALVHDFARSGDPIDPPGVRDDNLLASAVYRPHTAIGEVYKYPTVETSAAALVCALINDHPFHNGNKRTALVAMLVFLDENDVTLTCDEEQLFRLVLEIARHRVVVGSLAPHADQETAAVADRLHKWCRAIGRQFAPPTLTFRDLRAILTGYGCEIQLKSGAADITPPRGDSRWWRTRPSRKVQVHYQNEGADVQTNTVKLIREKLHLDADHGCADSDFFSKKSIRVDGFVARYQKTLKRLATL